MSTNEVQKFQLRMHAYYYGFAATGIQEIDLILSAVACAGKAFHNTEDWTEDSNPWPGHRGETPVLWIQNAAQDAAATRVADKAQIAELQAKCERLELDAVSLRTVIGTICDRAGVEPAFDQVLSGQRIMERIEQLEKKLAEAIEMQDCIRRDKHHWREGCMRHESRIEQLEAQLPEGMKDCTIVFKECEKGHGTLTATNWVQHPCATCVREQLEAALRGILDSSTSVPAPYIGNAMDPVNDLRIVSGRKIEAARRVIAAADGAK